MLIKSITDLGNGTSIVEVVDGSGFISRYSITTGTTVGLMKNLRESMN